VARIQDIVDMLAEATAQGRVDWTELAENRFGAKLGDNSIEAVRDIKGEYRITVFNSAGSAIESIVERQRATAGGLPMPVGKVIELYRSARRRALGVDKTLDEVANFLKNQK
jgi:hypothetical protein